MFRWARLANIRSSNTHSGSPVDGTMEVVEYEEDRLMGGVIHDGSTETIGRMTCEALGPDRTKIIIVADMPWMDESADSSRLETMTNIKNLIESET